MDRPESYSGFRIQNGWLLDSGEGGIQKTLRLLSQALLVTKL